MTNVDESRELHEAAKRQLAVHGRLDKGEHIPDWRYVSLRPGFQRRWVPEHGTGIYPVKLETGEVCEFEGTWLEEDRVLLCKHCFEDGT